MDLRVLPPERLSSRPWPFCWADGIVLLALIGLLATVAWLGHGMWVPFRPGAPPAVDLSPWNLPSYAGRSLLRMFTALGASLVFTLLVASWAAKSRRATWVILPALDILQSVPVLGFLSATVTFFMALAPGRLLGKSGSGKSTLLRILAGLIQPSEGEVRYRGQPVAGPCPGVAMVFQSFALLPWLDVLGNVELGLKARGVPPEMRRQKALQMIDLIGLDGFESAYPRELSGGMRQRVGVARALAVEPDILLMDVPFSVLDVLTAESLRGQRMDLWLARHTPIRAILLVTHNIEEAVLLADRVLIFGANPGHVRTEASVELPRPRTRDQAEVQNLVDRFYHLMTRPETPDEAQRVSAARPALMPLPHARVGALDGFLELLVDRGGREDLHRRAGDLQFEVDDLLPLVDAAALLGLARVDQADAILTPEGEAFAKASVLQRKERFRRILMEQPTLVSRIHTALMAKKNHRLPEDFFLDLLEKHFSAEEARRQLETAIHWGRYAELFGFEDDTDELFLETSEPRSA